MKWISVNTRKPKLGQKCICYYVMERYDKTIIKDIRILYYLKSSRDNRKRVFSDDYVPYTGPELNIGNVNWPVTDWMPLPNDPKGV